jgi:hypothetical protein
MFPRAFDGPRDQALGVGDKDRKNSSSAKTLAVLSFVPVQIKTTRTLMVAGEMRSRHFKAKISVGFLVSLIKDLSRAITTNTIEVITRIVNHIDNNTIIFIYIIVAPIVVMVLEVAGML